MWLRIVCVVLILFSAAPTFAKTARAYLMTTSTSVNVSELHIINTSDTAQQFSGTLYESGGTRLGTANRTLHSGSIQANERPTLFTVKPPPGRQHELGYHLVACPRNGVHFYA